MAGDFRSAMKSGVREMRVTGRAVLKTGAEIAVEARDIVSVRISEGSDSGLLPGNVLSAACSLVLDNSGGKWISGDMDGHGRLLGAVFELSLGVKWDGEWIFEPLGVFVCRDAQSDEGSTVITLSLSDYLDETGDIEFEDEMAYPCALGEVLENVLSQTGYDWKSDLENGDVLIDAKPRWGKISVREALGYVSQAAGCFARIGRGGEFRLIPVTGEGEVFEIGPEHYMERSRCDGYFGPVKAISIETVNAKGDEESESVVAFVGNGPMDGGAVIEISGNPLYITGGEHFSEVARGTLDALDGMEYRESRFTWRGDPFIGPGSRIKILGVEGGYAQGVVSRQTLEFDGGFHAECVCGVPGNGTSKASASGGGIDAGRLIGLIPGANISAESITAGKIAAGAITAEKIAAGAVTADKIDAGAITAGKIDAEAVTAGKIAAGAVTADKIAAGAIEAEKIAAGAVTAEKIEAGAIETEKIAAEAVTAEKIAAGAVEARHLKAGEITAEKIAAKTITARQLQSGLITATSGLIAIGAIQTAQIADGSITAAKIVSLNADVIESGTIKTDRLLLVGEGGLVYEINAAASGLSREELSEEEYLDHINGSVIVADSITARQIAAGAITANEIAVNAVTAAKIDVADLFASEATINEINAMDITGNSYLQMMVGGIKVGARNLIRCSRDMVFEDYGFDESGAAAVLGRGVLDRMILGGL